MKDVKLNFIHLCDAASIDSSGKLSILGIFSKIFLARVPGKFPKFTIVCSLSFKNLKDKKGKIRLKIFNSKKEEVKINPPIEFEFNVANESIKEVTDLNLILDVMNIEFLAFGNHKVVVYLYDNMIDETLFNVEKVK